MQRFIVEGSLHQGLALAERPRNLLLERFY